MDALRAEIRRIAGIEPPDGVLEARVAASGAWDDHGVLLGILRGGATIGTAQSLRCPRTAFPGVFEVGLTLFSEADRGQGYGSEALQLLVDHLFRESEAIRVWLATDVDNIPMRRTAVRLGFQEEGTLRGNRESEGSLVDAVLFGMTRDDFVDLS